MGTETIMARLAGMRPEELKKMWFSAMRIVLVGKGDTAAASKMLDEIESIERNDVRPDPIETVGELLFEPHGHRFVSFGYANGICVATIRKTAQHRSSGNRVYQVRVSGELLPESCRTIDDARASAARRFAER